MESPRRQARLSAHSASFPALVGLYGSPNGNHNFETLSPLGDLLLREESWYVVLDRPKRGTRLVLAFRTTSPSPASTKLPMGFRCARIIETMPGESQLCESSGYQSPAVVPARF